MATVNLKIRGRSAHKGRLLQIGLLTLVCALVGCMHTVLGGKRIGSPGGTYALGMQMHGAGGKAFTARTKKRVYVWIDTSIKHDYMGVPGAREPVTVFQKKYVFVAGDLCSRTQWHGSNSVSVVFFDYGDGVSSYDKRGAPSNHVATLNFNLDEKTGKFVERSEVRESVVLPGDCLRVFREGVDLRTILSPDGTIALPYGVNLHVAGLILPEVQARVNSEYGRVYLPRHIAVSRCSRQTTGSGG